MRNRTKCAAALAAGLGLVLAPVLALALDPAPKCESGKLKEAGKYAACRLKAESKGVLKGLEPDFSRCEEKFSTKWPVIEGKAGVGVCPSEGDETVISNFVDACDQLIADALAGGALVTDLVDCNNDLATCSSDLATCSAALTACEAEPRVLRTGQTTCYNASGTVIPCAGTGQDGEYQTGAARSFTDNGDGTITDNVTGLVWEKLSADGSIHDKDTTYTWTDAFSVKVATLNSTSFAGHSDWRVPNRFELDSLTNLGAVYPATYTVFHTGCTPGCTVTTCSCTRSSAAPTPYWSSSTYEDFPDRAWDVDFNVGRPDPYFKTYYGYARAVRGGS